MTIQRQNSRRKPGQDHTYEAKPSRVYHMRGLIDPNDRRRFEIAPSMRKKMKGTNARRNRRHAAAA